jgi:hypothetical protein
MSFRYPNTKALIDALVMDLWPSTACCVDFGIPLEPGMDNNGMGMYGLLQWGFKSDTITAEELDAACCNGPALTKIVKRIQALGQCPYGKDIEKVDLPWDHMPPEEDEDAPPDAG